MLYRKLYTCGYYGAVDSLDGKTAIKAGQYMLEFPDGSTGSFFVRIERGIEHAQIDMTGAPDVYPTHKAYIEVDFHGATVRVYLRDSNILIGDMENKV